MDENTQAKFKSYRRVMFLLGKTIKYTIWTGMALFVYHFALVKKMEKPETAMLVNPYFLEAARTADWASYAARTSMTKPWMTKMLPDRPNIPGYQHPKTLVLNLNGTLVHQTYKLGVGVEVFKRPGLSSFINRMSKQYEVVIFSMGESGTVNEVCEALDPNY